MLHARRVATSLALAPGKVGPAKAGPHDGGAGHTETVLALSPPVALPAAPVLELPAHSLPPIDVPVAALVPSNSIVRRGEFWEVKYEGRTSFVEDCRGLRYIALLIRDAQGERGPLHAKELVAMATGQPSEPIELEPSDSLLDEAARTAFMKRLEAIAAERARTEDETSLAALDEECDRIAEALDQAARGRRGHGRGSTFNTAGEKARKAVGKAISEAIVRIRSCSELSMLADHLAQTVRKGLWLSYGGTVAWQIEFDIQSHRAG